MDGADRCMGTYALSDAASDHEYGIPLIRVPHDTVEQRAFEILESAICGHVRQEECDLTMRQVAVLMTIARAAGNVSDIAKRLNMSFPSVSRAVDTLTKLNLASRSRPLEDKRVVVVNVTPKGYSMVGRLMAETMGVPIAA